MALSLNQQSTNNGRAKVVASANKQEFPITVEQGIRQVGPNRYQVRVFAGRNLETGAIRHVSKDGDGHPRISPSRAKLTTEVAQREAQHPSRDVRHSAGRVATNGRQGRAETTLDKYRAKIESVIRPALGAKTLARLTAKGSGQAVRQSSRATPGRDGRVKLTIERSSGLCQHQLRRASPTAVALLGGWGHHEAECRSGKCAGLGHACFDRRIACTRGAGFGEPKSHLLLRQHDGIDQSVHGRFIFDFGVHWQYRWIWNLPEPDVHVGKWSYHAAF